jgi:hypothetical protein
MSDRQSSVEVSSLHSPHRDYMEVAGRAFREGCGVSLIIFFCSFLSFFYGGWTFIKTMFYSCRACIFGTEAENESVSTFTHQLHNCANLIDENFGDPDRNYCE